MSQSYSDAQKFEVVSFVNSYNADHGKGGQNEAARRFKVSPLTISAWLKAAASNSQLSTLDSQPLEVVTGRSQTTAITEINQFHRRATGAADVARRASEEACHYALLAGTRLEQLRDSTPHGQWGNYFTDRRNPKLTANAAQIDECAAFEFSSDTALKYMEAAKRIRAEQSMSGIAQKKLIAIADAPELDDTGRAFLDKLTAGRTLRQLYLDLEIITAPAPKEKPEKPEKEEPVIRKSTAQAKLEEAREFFHCWRADFEKMVRIGCLDDLDKEGLLQLKEFAATVRERVTARLK